MNNQSNFFDRQTITAIILVFITWIGWQYYMKTKYPQMFQKPAVKEETKKTPEADKTLSKEAPTPANPPAVMPPAAKNVAESTYDYTSPNLFFQISSQGMGLKGIKLLNYKSRKGETVEFSSKVPPHSFETRLAGFNEPLNFEIQKISDNSWVGHARYNGLKITKTMNIDPTKYAIDVKVDVDGQDPKFVGLTTYLSDEVEQTQSGGFLNRNQFDRQEAFVDASESHNNHIYFSKDDIQKSWTNAHVVALGSQYFTQALVDHSPVLPDVQLSVQPFHESAQTVLKYSVLNHSGQFSIHYTAYVGPKSLSLLKSVDEEFVPVIDFGFFSWIARYILVMLKGFYALSGNWGFAIILLTILVRLIVMPFNIVSYRSMKAMQILQPQMAAIRERYKEDQQRMNQEVMALFRQHKVNPMGGCLPLLLQLPIFWALYQVLGHSIELYQAPFVFWIHDLSLKDPYYVLPVLMGITMFLQQQITPSATMDPAQAKIMKFVPLVFAFFMVSLPSGLTLYILVSALFAVVQQYYFMKTHKPLNLNK